MSKNISPCKVAQGGMTRLIEQYSKDCTPSQFIREYVKNSIEAIARTKKEGTIQVDVNWIQHEQDGSFRISFTDNGDGMTGEEMMKLLNQLSSSGHINENENYGMGAKISSMTRNKHGLIYESWKNGEGNMVWVRYDQSENAYGLNRFERHGGEVFEFQPIDDALKINRPGIVKSEGHCIIDQHGTRVTLCGNVRNADTMSMPNGIKLTKES